MLNNRTLLDKDMAGIKESLKEYKDIEILAEKLLAKRYTKDLNKKRFIYINLFR